jgi:hypothetical protein
MDQPTQLRLPILTNASDMGGLIFETLDGRKFRLVEVENTTSSASVPNDSADVITEEIND